MCIFVLQQKKAWCFWCLMEARRFEDSLELNLSVIKKGVSFFHFYGFVSSLSWKWFHLLTSSDRSPQTEWLWWSPGDRVLVAQPTGKISVLAVPSLRVFGELSCERHGSEPHWVSTRNICQATFFGLVNMGATSFVCDSWKVLMQSHVTELLKKVFSS